MENSTKTKYKSGAECLLLAGFASFGFALAIPHPGVATVGMLICAISAFIYLWLKLERGRDQEDREVRQAERQAADERMDSAIAFFGDLVAAYLTKTSASSTGCRSCVGSPAWDDVFSARVSPQTEARAYESEGVRIRRLLTYCLLGDSPFAAIWQGLTAEKRKEFQNQLEKLAASPSLGAPPLPTRELAFLIIIFFTGQDELALYFERLSIEGIRQLAEEWTIVLDGSFTDGPPLQ
jgi:hypothetical protein